jgi:hypothetical protein
MSDIGILNTPDAFVVVVLVLGWPLLLAGALVGGLVGWRLARRRRPWLGAVVGALIGAVVGGIGFLAYSAIWID